MPASHRWCPTAVWSILAQAKDGYAHHPEVVRSRDKAGALHLRHEAVREDMERRGFVHRSTLDRRLATGRGGLAHHNLFLDRDWVRHFDAIFERPSWPADPSYYISAPSKTDDSIAPPGGENLFLLVPVAPGLQDTPEIRAAYTEKILSHFEGLLGQKIRDSIVVQRTFAHNDFVRDYNAYKGSALGLTHTMRQTASFRPRHHSKKVSNLYYTGQYTHPGIGVPMTLISSTIVADEIAQLA